MSDLDHPLMEITPSMQAQAKKIKEQRSKNHARQHLDEKFEDLVSYASKVFAITLLIFGLLFMVFSAYTINNLMKATANSGPPEKLSELVGNNASELSIQFQVLAEFELEAIRLRHSRATSFMQTRMWLRYSSMTLGFLCVVVGCAFILARVRSPKIDASAEGGGVKGSISTASPGLALVACGIVLCIIPNVARQEIEISNNAIYLSALYDLSTVSLKPNSETEVQGETELDLPNCLSNEICN